MEYSCRLLKIWRKPLQNRKRGYRISSTNVCRHSLLPFMQKGLSIFRFLGTQRCLMSFDTLNELFCQVCFHFRNAISNHSDARFLDLMKVSYWQYIENQTRLHIEPSLHYYPVDKTFTMNSPISPPLMCITFQMLNSESENALIHKVDI